MTLSIVQAHGDHSGRFGDDPSANGGDSAVNVLIVDDEPKNLMVLESVLDSPRYRVIRAEFGRHGTLGAAQA